MFTGIIEAVGVLQEVRSRGNYRVLTVESALPINDIATGESIACDGACLTVVDKLDKAFVAEASQETYARTILNNYRVGTRINLERALQVGSRLGGHFVTGHVDDTGVVEYLRPVGESLELAVKFNPAHDPLVIEKGSIAVNGLSLTVNEVRSGWFNVNLIPHTVKMTTIGRLQPGQGVNLEFDLIGKYVLKYANKDSKRGLNKDKLLESGW